MKVDLTQCLDYRNKIREHRYSQMLLPISELVIDMLVKISYKGPVGRMEFDSKDFYPEFDKICNSYNAENGYVFVALFVEVFMPFLGAGMSVGENSNYFANKKGTNHDRPN